MSQGDMDGEPADNFSDFGLIAIDLPAFEAGGRVDRTGLALVHEGEYILPAPGSAAEIHPGSPGGRTAGEIHYHFPVVIEMVGELADHHVKKIADHVFDEFERSLRG